MPYNHKSWIGKEIRYGGHNYEILDNFVSGTRGSDHYSTDIEYFLLRSMINSNHKIQARVNDVIENAEVLEE